MSEPRSEHCLFFSLFMCCVCYMRHIFSRMCNGFALCLCLRNAFFDKSVLHCLFLHFKYEVPRNHKGVEVFELHNQLFLSFKGLYLFRRCLTFRAVCTTESVQGGSHDLHANEMHPGTKGRKHHCSTCCGKFVCLL